MMTGLPAAPLALGSLTRIEEHESCQLLVGLLFLFYDVLMLWLCDVVRSADSMEIPEQES